MHTSNKYTTIFRKINRNHNICVWKRLSPNVERLSPNVIIKSDFLKMMKKNKFRALKRFLRSWIKLAVVCVPVKIAIQSSAPNPATRHWKGFNQEFTEEYGQGNLQNPNDKFDWKLTTTGRELLSFLKTTENNHIKTKNNLFSRICILVVLFNFPDIWVYSQ